MKPSEMQPVNGYKTSLNHNSVELFVFAVIAVLIYFLIFLFIDLSLQFIHIHFTCTSVAWFR